MSSTKGESKAVNSAATVNQQHTGLIVAFDFQCPVYNHRWKRDVLTPSQKGPRLKSITEAQKDRNLIWYCI